MGFIRFDHVALEVSDLDRSIDFYVRCFGFNLYSEQLVRGNLRIAYLRLGEVVLELVGEARAKMQGFHFCLISDDFDGEVARLRGMELELVTAPHPTGAREPHEEGWRRVVFAGPDGEHIEIRG